MPDCSCLDCSVFHSSVTEMQKGGRSLPLKVLHDVLKPDPEFLSIENSPAITITDT